MEVFGSVFCPYCHQVRDLLEERGIPFEYHEIPMVLGWKLPLPCYFEMKRRSGGMKTVPQIFLDGEYYGDEERLFEEDGKGELERGIKKGRGT